MTDEKDKTLIRVYVGKDVKKQVADVSDKMGLAESAWVRMLIIRELKEIDKEEKDG